MAVTNYKLEDGSTLVVTSVPKVITSTELVTKQTPYTETTQTVIPGPVPPVPNKLPLVAAGIDQQITLPSNEVTLRGVVSDSDGTIVKQLWTKVSGPAATISTPTALITKVVGMVVGDYMFKLTATDDKGGVTADDLNVKVYPILPIPPIPPIPGKVDYLKLPTLDLTDFDIVDDMVVSNYRITNPNGVAMNLVNRRNIKFIDCFFDFAKEEHISFERSAGLWVERCLFNDMNCGVYGLDSSGIKVVFNQFMNTRMRTTGGRGQFVQLNNCFGPNIEINDNKGENWLGESNPEDLISLFNSSGTSGSHISIRRNMFRGGGPSDSGGGIMTGDNGGSWQIAEGNSLMDPGQYGMASAGGFNIQLINNKIYAKQQPFTNNPLYVWAQAGAGCGNITVKGNRVNWTDKRGGKNNGWNAGNCSNVAWEDPTTIEFEQMGFPVHLLDFVTPAQLLTIRNS